MKSQKNHRGRRVILLYKCAIKSFRVHRVFLCVLCGYFDNTRKVLR